MARLLAELVSLRLCTNFGSGHRERLPVAQLTLVDAFSDGSNVGDVGDFASALMVVLAYLYDTTSTDDGSAGVSEVVAHFD